MQPEITLKKYFGYDSFRSNQKDIVNSVISKNDTLVIMPTGGGKSLCFQIPGLMLSGVTIVVSPLISLMQDQVEALQKKNIKSTFINSSLSKDKLKNRLDNLSSYKFIYIAPERLQTKSWKQASEDLSISMIAVDEAHCISQWGHDFRPPYLQISDYIDTLGKRPIIIALTATATPDTKNKIVSSLQLIKPNIFLGSFTRINLILIIKKYETKFEKQLTLFHILNKHKDDSGIIYTQTRKQSEYLSQLINFYLPKRNCHSYHAGLTSENRSSIQTKFINDEINLITATNAFGMGVDKSNVRFVIHFGTPGSLENYYQEVGRAGRDNETSWCYLLYHPSDKKINLDLLKASKGKQKIIRENKLKKIMNLIHDRKCLTKTLALYFGDESNEKIKGCNCSICNPISVTFTKTQIKLINKLIKLRTVLAKKHRLHVNQIMTDQVIAYLVLLRPKNKINLLKIPGIGRGWVDQWSDDIIPTI